MSRNPNSWSSERKKNLVLDIIRGETTLAAASKTHGLPASKIEHWIEIGMAGMENALKTKSPNIQTADYDQSEHEQSPLEHDPSLIYRSAEEIQSELSKLYEDLGRFFDLTIPYERLCKNLTGWLDYGKTAGDLLADKLWDYYDITGSKQKTRDHYISTITLATAYCLESVKLIKKGHVDQALNSLEEAKESQKEAEENASVEYKDNIKSERAKAGGKARSDNKYSPARTIVARFLKDNRPPDGWKSMAEAASAIDNSLNKLEDNNTTALNEKTESNNNLRIIKKTLIADDRYKTLYNWIRKDKELREIFEKMKEAPKR